MKPANKLYIKNLKMTFPASKLKCQLPLVLEFLHNPDFKYNVADHYDLGIENACGVLYLAPTQRSVDHELLRTLHGMFPEELDRMHRDPKLWHPSFPYPMSFNEPTRFANNNIAAFLETCIGNPLRTKIMRRVIYHLLSQD